MVLNESSQTTRSKGIKIKASKFYSKHQFKTNKFNLTTKCNSHNNLCNKPINSLKD